MPDIDRKAIAKRALPLLDLTNLNDDCTEADIDTLCDKALTPHGAVAAVCIWPRFVAQAREKLRGTPVRIATVVNFPDGGTDVDAAVAEAREAAFDGAHEVDLVFPYRAFAAGEQIAAIGMITAVRHGLPDTVKLKVILETGELKVPELIRIASVKAIQAGADFIKTSTGKVKVNATEQAAHIMIEAIHEGGKPVGFKAAGGIRTTEDAAHYLSIADSIMGDNWAGPETFRFGASGLLADLLAALDGGTAGPSGGY